MAKKPVMNKTAKSSSAKKPPAKRGAKAKAPAPVNTGEQREDVGPGKPPTAHQFKSGNKGRPKGSRNRLGEAFLKALADDFETGGVAAIEKVRADRPQDYLRVCASLMPKELNVNINPLEEMTDEQLIRRIRELGNAVEGVVGGTGGAVGGAQAKAGPQQTRRVPPVH